MSCPVSRLVNSWVRIWTWHCTLHSTMLGMSFPSSEQTCSSLPSSQFSHSVVSDSLWPCELQHARLPCPSPTPGACSDLCPSSWWCHPTISSSVVPFSSCLQSLPASGSFPVSQFFTSGGQSTGASVSASVLPMKYSGLISFRKSSAFERKLLILLCHSVKLSRLRACSG